LFCPIIFGRPFLHTIGAEIYLPKLKVVIECGGERLEFNFSKFSDKHSMKEPLAKDIFLERLYFCFQFYFVLFSAINVWTPTCFFWRRHTPFSLPRTL
jgi:hypothetical protein